MFLHVVVREKEQWSPIFLVLGTNFVKEKFSMEWAGAGMVSR